MEKSQITIRRLKKKMEDFRRSDEITGRKLDNPLNKKKLSSQEMDEIFLED